jgi:hypothetical protein
VSKRTDNARAAWGAACGYSEEGKGMGAGRTRQRRRRWHVLQVSFVVLTLFAAGLVSAGVVAGAGPLGVLSTSTDVDTTEPTDTESTTDSTTTETESTTTDTEPTESEPTETTPGSSACAPTGNETIATDKADYAPEETVHMTGAGYSASCDVIVKVTRPNGSVVVGDGSFQPGSDTATTGADGSLAYDYILNGVLGLYTVEVLGADDAVLTTTTFSDHQNMSVEINANAAETNTLAVTLNLSWGGSGGDPTQGRFANDTNGGSCADLGTGTWSAWEAVTDAGNTNTATKSWTLAAGAAGTRKVCAETAHGVVGTPTGVEADDDSITFTTRQFTAVISPTSATTGTATTYTLTVTNTSDDTSVLGCVRVSVPTGAGTPGSFSVAAADPGPTTRTWAAPTLSSGVIQTQRTGGPANDIDVGGTIAITFTTTASTASTKEWTTSAFGNNGCGTAAELEGAQPSVVVTVADGSAPTGSVAVNGGAAATSSTSVTLDLNATDGVGVTAYRVANGPSCSAATYVSVTPTTSFSASIPHTLTVGDGTKTVCAQYRDAAGNESETYTDTIVLDTVKPTLTASATSPPGGAAYTAGTWTRFDVEVAFACTDALSGVATDSVPDETVSTEGADQSVTSTGNCTDNAGNEADPATFANIDVDKTAPGLTASATSPPDGAAYTAGDWTRFDVKVAFACTDGLSGVATDSVPDETVSTEGTTALVTSTGDCIDEAGNEADPASFGPIMIDKTAPTLTASATSPPGGAAYTAGTWTRFDVEVAFDCADALSGVATDTVLDVTVSMEGANQSVTSSGDCIDAAGNEADPETFADIDIDKTKPTLASAATSPPGGAAYTPGTWTRFDVEVTFDCTDALSEVATDTVPDVTVTAEGSNQSVTSTGNCTDNAGNEADPATFSDIDIDKSNPNAPLVSADRAPEYAGGGGWFKDTVTVSFVGNGDPDLADASPGSGVDPASIPAPQTFTTSGPHTPTGTVKDNAGNESASAGLTVQVDATNPTFGACTGGPFLLGSGMQPVSITASDAHSGLDAVASTLSGSVDTSTIGTKNVAFTAVDNVGHSVPKTCSYSVIFNFHGFFQPVDNNGVFNSVNSGRAIPVKFDLSGNQGLDIFEAGYPKSTVVPCSGGAAVDILEETTTAGNSTLHYSEGQPFGQYNYVWKTEKAWANSCRRLDLKFVDGMTYSALFKFTK